MLKEIHLVDLSVALMEFPRAALLVALLVHYLVASKGTKMVAWTEYM